jgi:hypothetical protein
MNEQLQASLAKLITQATSGIDAGTAFLKAQLPDVIQQLLTWTMYYDVFIVTSGLVLIVVSLTALAKFIKSNPTSDIIEPVLAVSGSVSTIGFLMIISHIVEPFKIWIAPKIWLIEYAAHLAK